MVDLEDAAGAVDDVAVDDVGDVRRPVGDGADGVGGAGA